MPLLENLVEGFANAAGATGAANAIEAKKQRRQNLSDMELEDTVQAHMDVMKGLQAKLGQNPDNPQLQQQLSQERDQLFQLLHPANNPDALGRVKQLFRHVFRQQEPQQKQPVNNLPSVEAMMAAAPQGEFPGFSPEDRKKAERIKAGLDPRATADKPDPENWTVVQGTANGQPFTIQHNSKNGQSETLDGKPVPPDVLASFVPTPHGGANKPIRAWTNKNGKITSVLLDPQTNKPMPGTENVDIQPPAYMTGRITTGYYHWIDQNNQVHQTEETRTSRPANGNTPTTAKPPGQQKKDLQAMARPKTGGDRIIGTSNKRTTAQNKADNDFVEATKLASVADQVAQKPDDAINQKRLAVSLERASAGRFTTQALDYIIKAGWGNTIEQWANNPSTGALPKDVMRQLVDGAHENLKAAKDARAAAFGAASTGDVSDDDIIKALNTK